MNAGRPARVALALVTLASSAAVSGSGHAPAPAQGDARTPLFKCGVDEQLANEIPLRWGHVVLAGDGRLFAPCGPQHAQFDREVRESQLLSRAYRSQDPELRWRAVQAYARLGIGLGELQISPTVLPACQARIQVLGGLTNPRRFQPGILFRSLLDADNRVREEAAYGIALALGRRAIDSDLVKASTEELKACLARRQPDRAAGLILEAIGVARHGTDEERTLAEEFLVAQAQGPAVRILGAVKGLEALFRQNTQRGVSRATRERLRALVSYGARAVVNEHDPDVRIRRLALMALNTVGDQDAPTLAVAARDADWQVRRLVALQLNLSRAEDVPIALALDRDDALQVRYEMVGVNARHAARTTVCSPVARFLDDPEPTVAMRAMDALVPVCGDLEDTIVTLGEIAGALERGESHERWHLPSRALTALARLSPKDASRLLPAAVEHPVWQVRAGAAGVARLMGLTPTAVTLAADRHPNVQHAALDALFRLRSREVVTPAIEVLKYGSDYQVLRTAAMVLEGAPEERREEASAALLYALRRLTDEESDTSRDPRVAIVLRLGEMLWPGRAGDLLRYTGDFDPQVRAAAAKVFASLVQAPVAEEKPWVRYPYQPTEEALGQMPATATMVLDGGVVTLELLREVAPVTVARFARLANTGYYDGLTFHRIVPNFVVQGGSPGANEYVGASRFMRDEPGLAPHIRGAVGTSTRGWDTGDAQIFIDLVDLPRLDRDYTVFAYVTEGMALIDRLLEGAVIKSIRVQ